MATGYGELLRAPHVLRLLTGTLVGRLPHGTAPLAIVLFTRAEGGGYTLAGALAATHGLATAVGQPLLGRLVDLRGQPRVMFPAALVSALAMAALAVLGTGSVPLAAALVLLAGLTTPPLEGALRALWSGVLGTGERLRRAYALDAVAQEVMFAGGPLLVMLLVAAWSEAAALLVINVVGLLGAVSLLVSAPSREWRAEPRDAHWLGALRSGGLLALLGCFLCVGMALGAISVASVAYADAGGEELIASYLLSALGVGALVGGLTYGARPWSGAPEPRLLLLVVALAVGYLPLALTPASVPLMTLLAGLSGVFLAPTLACAFVVIDRHAPRGTVTEAFSWLVTTFGVGTAIGTAAVGPVIEWGDASLGFLVAGVAGWLAVLVLLGTRGVLAVPGGVANPQLESRNDRNAVLEPGFKSGHQA
ncbi:MFS transporter [Streptomyces sp. DSM 44915]|uniref:MFS transporter n=1 Tax=Streptomyces chisholmiae TaxID=3075540 RepID=A0ABU2JYM5_9ACTN|nr:MFS transporter [Streptomyces sp. DSM 44915]MDT0269947.1 MFS transporter [Streptomyces sp. DSM 44915]